MPQLTTPSESITMDEFITKFEPIMVPGIKQCRPHFWSGDKEALDLAIAERRCWTAVLDEESRPHIISGYAADDRFYNVVTAKPYDDGRRYTVAEDEEGWATEGTAPPERYEIIEAVCLGFILEGRQSDVLFKEGFLDLSDLDGDGKHDTIRYTSIEGNTHTSITTVNFIEHALRRGAIKHIPSDDNES